MLKYDCFFSALIFFLISTDLALAQTKLPVIIDLLQKIEDSQNLVNTDLTLKAELTQYKSDGRVNTLEGLFFRSDTGNLFLLIMTAPENEKGNGYLQADNNIWVYRRNTRTFEHINREENISGTEVKAGEYEKRKWHELYEPCLSPTGGEMITAEELGKDKIPVYKFSIKAKVKDVTYPLQTIWVKQDDNLVLKIQSYSLSETLLLTTYYLQYINLMDKKISLKQIFIDEFDKGNRTVQEFSGISLKKIDKSVFTKAYLENLSK